MNLFKKTLVLLLTLLVCFSAFSCANGTDSKKDADGSVSDTGKEEPKPDNPEDQTPEITGDYIFAPGTAVNLVYNGDHLTHTYVSDIYFTLCDLIENQPMLVNDKSAEGAHARTADVFVQEEVQDQKLHCLAQSFGGAFGNLAKSGGTLGVFCLYRIGKTVRNRLHCLQSDLAGAVKRLLLFVL